MSRPRGDQAAGSVRRVERRTLVEDVYAELRRSIVAGQLTPGAPLVERRLADDLGTSRGPVREALVQLTQEGLVREGPTRGTLQVRRFTATDIVDLYNVRLGIEPVAARLAARRREPADTLRSNLRRMSESAGDLNRFVELDMDFHQQLCAMSENAYITQVVAALAAQLRIAFAADTELTVRPEHIPQLVGEHESILAAIENGDEDAAARGVIDHIMGFERETMLNGLLASPIPPPR